MEVLVADIDPLACAAIPMNAELNGVEVARTTVSTSLELEDRTRRDVVVYRIVE